VPRRLSPTFEGLESALSGSPDATLLKAQILEDPQELRFALSAYNQKYNEWIQRYYGFGLTPENLREYLTPIRQDYRPGVF